MTPSLTITPVSIPMRYEFAHARAKRTVAENVIVRADLGDGIVGWGEAVPRDYVTGETVSSVVDTLRRFSLQDLEIGPQLDFEDAVKRLWDLDLPNAAWGKALSPCAACAIELAVLDALGRRSGHAALDALGVIEAVRHLRREPRLMHVRRTLTVGGDVDGALRRAGSLTGDLDVKLKVGFGIEVDRERLKRLRERFGREVDIRLDANGAWNLSEAIRSLNALAEFSPSLIEEPLAKGRLDDCARLRRETTIPVMLDETLCTVEDAKAAIERGAADLFNLRISKCGGVLGTLRIAHLAQKSSVQYSVGSMVGESSILAAAGRALAASLSGVRYYEAGVPAAMLEADLAKGLEEVDVGRRISAVPWGPGLGVAVLPERVSAYAVS